MTEDVDQDVVVISGPELEGLLVVPRQHIGGLDQLSAPDRGRLLAALRRAARLVQERNPGSATKVVVMTVPPASEGHVCSRSHLSRLRIPALARRDVISAESISGNRSSWWRNPRTLVIGVGTPKGATGPRRCAHAPSLPNFAPPKVLFTQLRLTSAQGHRYHPSAVE